MTYEDFYDLACYGNESWKGWFSEKEVACMAYDWLVEFEESKANDSPTQNMIALMESLRQDNTPESLAWCEKISQAIYG